MFFRRQDLSQAVAQRNRTSMDLAHGDVPHLPPDYHPTMNHPNRSRNNARTPTAEEVKLAREASGLSPFEAGAMVYERESRWLDFEHDRARMHPAAFELFKLKTGQV